LSDKWLVIVNPNAGVGKGRRDWKEISEILIKEGFDFDAVLTERKYQAIEITSSKIEEGYRKIIVVGGDGTMNEVVNGIFIQKFAQTTDITIGLITVGTGNDWGRMYKIPLKYKKSVKVIKKGKTFIQDVGLAAFFENNEPKQRYFMNIAGMGFDALVAKKTNAMKEKGRGGTLAYLFNLVTGLFQFRNIFLDMHIDGEKVFSGNVFSMCLGICKYNGGGMMQLPGAVPDDGIIDVTVIKKTSKFNVIKNIRNLYDGSFIKLPVVETFTGKQVSIVTKAKKSVFLETDGESLGHSPLGFSIIPRSLKIIINPQAFHTFTQ